MNIKSYEFQLAIRLISKDVMLYDDKSVLMQYRFIKNPIFRWLADPFLLELNGRHYIFAESASRITGKGKLIYCEINPSNYKNVKWKKCLKKGFHLSFPNVSVENGVVSMMPETYQDKCVAKYFLKNNGSFNAWTKGNEIASGVEYVDSVTFNDKYITYDISSESNTLKLLSPNGKVLDEIKDVNLSLRPAGKLFEYDGKTVFVSQNCKTIYGQGLNFNYISATDDKMNIDCFLSIDYCDLNSLFCKTNFIGIHTYNFDSQFEIIDVRVERFSVVGLFGKIFDKIKKHLKIK